MSCAASHRALGLLRDFKYFFLILLTLWTCALFWFPLKVLGLFLGDRASRLFIRFFLLFD